MTPRKLHHDAHPHPPVLPSGRKVEAADLCSPCDQTHYPKPYSPTVNSRLSVATSNHSRNRRGALSRPIRCGGVGPSVTLDCRRAGPSSRGVPEQQRGGGNATPKPAAAPVPRAELREVAR